MISRRAFIATAAGLLVPAPFAMAQRFRRMGGGQAWSAGSILLDGTSWLECQSGLFADSKTFTVSFWARPAAGSDSTVRYVIRHQTGTSTGSYRYTVRLYSDNKARLGATNSSSTEIAAYPSSSTVLAAGGWAHVSMRGNLANAADFTCWINGIQQTGTPSPWTNAEIDFGVTTPRTLIGNGSTAAPSQPMVGELAEVWVSTSDLGAAAGTAFSAAGKPAYLGATGTVSGVTPQLYLSRSTVDPVTAFLANRGSSGGTFLQSGTVGVGGALVSR